MITSYLLNDFEDNTVPKVVFRSCQAWSNEVPLGFIAVIIEFSRSSSLILSCFIMTIEIFFQYYFHVF